MYRVFVRFVFLLIVMGLASRLWAGGSGYNVVIVVNQNSTNSVQLGNYYRVKRNLPPQNFLRINWTGTNTVWTPSDFTNTLVTPLLNLITNNKLTNQIDYVVLSMDIPYKIYDSANGFNSTTAALFYGFKNDPGQASSCEIPSGSTNLYAASESIFRATPSTSGNSNFFLVTMITANDLPTAEMVVQQGVISDSTFPTNTVWLGTSSDPDRNVRYSEFDNTVFNTRLRTNYSVIRTNTDQPLFTNQILGYQNGFYYYEISPDQLFVPGAMADHLTSFGGVLFEDNSGQTTLIKFLAAGAAGSYGTVVEPCDFTGKFPDSQNYFYQSRGFSLAECYYQSLVAPYEGLVAGEPLAAPFAQPGAGSWTSLTNNALVIGATNLPVQFTASDAQHPLQQLDLFLDGTYVQTVTNMSPQSGNVLNVSLKGNATSYTVPAGATIKSIASNLVSVLNGAIYQNKTKVTAIAHGDRIELQSIAPFTTTGSQITVSAGSSTPSGTLNTFLNAAKSSTFLDSIAHGVKVYQISGSPVSSSTLTLSVTKTNNAIVSVTVTNSSNATLPVFTQQFLTTISNTAALQGTDGLTTAADLLSSADGSVTQFNLHANGAGFAAAQIKASITGSVGLIALPAGLNTLTDNTTDLEPRNHLYITTGVTNMAVNVPMNTVNFADGYHELAAVAYEGSHVHTQTRAVQEIVIKNTQLTATLAPSLTGTNSALQPTLQIVVAANTNNIASIQLFSTGGLLSTINNQSTATFNVDFSMLGIGTHPFYAIVTDGSGHQYKTATQTIGLIGVSFAGSTLVGVDLGFPLQINSPAATLIWPATAGRTYGISSTTNLLSSFQVRDTVTPTNSVGQWTETNTSPAQQFYRVSVAP